MKEPSAKIFLIIVLIIISFLPACASKKDYAGHGRTSCPASLEMHKGRIDVHLLEMLTEIHGEIDAAAGTKTKLTLVPGSQPNAYALEENENRYIALNTALLDLLGDNEDEYAFVIAHEAAHISKKHLKKRENYNNDMNAKSSVLGLAMEAIGFGFGIPFSGVISSLTVESGSHLMKLGYSRDNEREADKEGLKYMDISGFNPSGSVTFLEKLISLPNGSSIPILSTHPHSRERLDLLETEIARINSEKRLPN